MTTDQKNRFLVEEVLGLEYRKPTHGSCCTCQKCGHDHDGCICFDFYSTDPTERAVNFFRLLDAIKGEEWFDDFVEHYLTYRQWRFAALIDGLADAVYEFRKGEK